MLLRRKRGVLVHLPVRTGLYREHLVGTVICLVFFLLFTLCCAALSGCQPITPETAARIADCGARYQSCWIQSPTMADYLVCRSRVDADCLEPGDRGNTGGKGAGGSP
jgi:hypothetical protein